MLQLYANIKERRRELGMSQDELASKTGYKDRSSIAKIEKGLVDLSRTKIDLFAAALKTTQSELMGWDDAPYKENEDGNTEHKIKGVRIPVLGSVPAGIPIEAIEDIIDWEDIPMKWLAGDHRYIGLRVKGDSMYPKYIEGDTIIIRLQPDCENGQDAVVYVNGYDATLKKVLKNDDGIMLQPLNPEYVPRQYDYDDDRHPISILGVVVEIRRKV